jgi:hypothetical protein
MTHSFAPTCIITILIDELLSRRLEALATFVVSGEELPGDI